VDERFVSLAAFVCAAATTNVTPPVVPDSAPVAPEVTRGVIDFAHADLVHELALLRLAALEAFERGTETLLRSLADDVLGRELELGPAAIETLAKRALGTFADHEPVALAISPADAERVRVPLPVRIDPALAAGDLIVDVRDGAFESHFAFRLEAALERAQRSA